MNCSSIKLVIVTSTLLWTGACLPELPELDDPCGNWTDPGPYHWDLHVNGKKRHVRVYVPEGEGPRDMIVGLHGARHNNKDFVNTTKLEVFAENRGIVAATPNGTGWIRTWNGGDCCGNSSDIDLSDMFFLEQSVAHLSRRLCIDRVLVTGISNGAMMAHKWACQGSNLDAVVPVSGTLEDDECEGDPVPIRMYHGTADPVVPYDGGQGNSVDHSFSGVDHTLGVWLERNLCSNSEPEVTVSGSVTCEEFDCAASTVLCTVEGGGHGWPGESGDPGTENVNAGLDSWDWFNGLPIWE
ncbi:MAG: hypothetical protein HN348_14445 [Proteobacteria bacterium]|jgi:polyhydroxybutyrate depolymerase|nr:hypothetical protein [Pseudomonadota bacterium]